MSYAHDDLEKVRSLQADLKVRSVNVWFDKENIVPGKWKTQIQKAIPKSRYFLFCISNTALQKTENGSGFIDAELQQAYEIAMAQDERYFTIIPVRLENVDRGDHRLSIFQQYDLFDDWERAVDKLAVYLGGKALASVIEKEKQTEEKKLLFSLMGKADAAAYSKEYNKAVVFLEAAISMITDYADTWSNEGDLSGNLGRYVKDLNALSGMLRAKQGVIQSLKDRSRALEDLKNLQTIIYAERDRRKN